jgi:uncharacterized LabA/DUF88 family protein
VATNVYVDAFNLYYGCLRGTPYRWLDLGALCTRLLPRDRIKRIRYFTAALSVRPDNPRDRQRQQTYLRALETVPGLSIHYGRFLSHVVRMPLANPPPTGARTVAVVKTEEKSSDVNLATFLLLDAFKRECGTAVVVSNDSDLKLPIEVAQTELGLHVGVVNPHPPAQRSRALRSSPMGGERFTSPRAGSGNAEARRSGPRTQPPKRLGGYADRSLRSGQLQTKQST